MNARTFIYRAVLLALIATVQPCWAQQIDPATELRTPVSNPGRRVFDARTTGMSPEIIRPGANALRRSEIRHIPPALLEQIGQVKQSMPSHVGVP
ncbi:MAG: hypothetical protein HYX67_11655 [Candidatus Melainabacteria bacterium]|nr:hypothetical protein [Candidatus Melainabacteria bacterium]